MWVSLLQFSTDREDISWVQVDQLWCKNQQAVGYQHNQRSLLDSNTRLDIIMPQWNLHQNLCNSILQDTDCSSG